MFSLASSAPSMPTLPPRAGRMHAGPKLGILHERIEVLAEDLGRFDQGHFGMDRAVGPDLQRELVVVRLLADAGFFDFVADAGDGAINRVDRNDADFVVARAVLGRGNIAAAVFDDHFHHERHVVGQRGDDVVLVDDLDVGIGLDIGAR